MDKSAVQEIIDQLAIAFGVFDSGDGYYQSGAAKGSDHDDHSVTIVDLLPDGTFDIEFLHNYEDEHTADVWAFYCALEVVFWEGPPEPDEDGDEVEEGPEQGYQPTGRSMDDIAEIEYHAILRYDEIVKDVAKFRSQINEY